LREVVHILGCGRFGRRALEHYAGRAGTGEIILVDSDGEHLDQAREHFSRSAANCRYIRQEAEIYLAERLTAAPPDPGEWIIPTVPFHLAFAALSLVLDRPALPWSELPALPNLFFVGERHEICSSLADFQCPPDCPQPRSHCYQTGQPREYSLFKVIAKLEYHLDHRRLLSLILASTQLAPGLGGFPLRRLCRVMNFIRSRHPEPLLFSTACRCHGVTNILGPAR